MLIVDLSNLVFGVMSDYHRTTGAQCDMSLMRNLILRRLKSMKSSLSKFSDEIVIACDSRVGYWRKEIFPYYKGNRSTEGSTMDWGLLYECFDQFKQELRENFPVKVVEVPKAEADDIMAVLASRYGSHLPICIYSSDKDLLQIQNFAKNVKQFSMAKNKFITPQSEKYSLFEHVVKAGDDGIPNILSDPDTFMVEGKRQKPMMKKKLEEWRKYGIEEPERFCTPAMLERFQMNRKLVDLSCIPDDLQMKIVDAYDEAKPAMGKVFSYMTAHRLKQLMKEGGF